MQMYFDQFKETIDTAQATGNLSEGAKLILSGRIAYAVERLDLSVAEGRRLEQMLGSDFAERYLPTLQVAVYGTPDSAVHATTG